MAFNKKLILKLPYRSDALAYVECITSLREHHLVSCHGDKSSGFGVRGMTVVNALKSPVPNYDDKLMPNTPAWYADPNAWGDASEKMYQMSGRFVGPYRNQILSGLLSDKGLLRSLGLDIWISGGLTSANEVRFCRQKGGEAKDLLSRKSAITGIQIGTWALLSTELHKSGKQNWEERKGPTGPARLLGPYQLVVKDCAKGCCETIHEACPYDAIEKKEKGKQVVVKAPEKCQYCQKEECISKCKLNKLFRILHVSETTSPSKMLSKGNKKAFRPRFSFLNVHRCQACGQCSQTFYCDTFLDRVHTDLPPLMDNRYCNGCGLCAQVCPSGALQLYPPENFLVLLSSSRERKEMLDTLHIPHLQYHPERDLEKFPEWIKGDLLGALEQPDSSTERLTAFWDNRIKRDTFMLHGDKPDLYPEMRKERKQQCMDVTKRLLGQLKQINSQSDNSQYEAVRRAVVWSQLLWSDPGQVLWDSFLLSIQSAICLADGTVPGMEFNDAILDKTFTVKTWVVLLRQGRIMLNRELDQEKRNFRLAMTQKTAAAYRWSGFGKDRAAGLDIRACGDMLVRKENNSPLSHEDKIALAGLPWQAIKDALRNQPLEYTGTHEEYAGHQEAFERLCHSVIE